MSDRATGRWRLAWLLGLWTVTLLLVAGQAWWVLWLAQVSLASFEADGSPIFPSHHWRVGGTLVPLLLAATALILQYRWNRDVWRTLAGIGMALLAPFAAICLLIAWIGGPVRMDSECLQSGECYVLTSELVGLDPGYALYEAEGPFGFYWRRVSWLDSPDDGRFMGAQTLDLSSDGQWLVAGRAGLWTDCFRVVQGRPIDCRVEPIPTSYQTTYEAEMRLRSRRITALTGMRP